MRSVVAVVTLALVAILCLPGAAQAGGPSAKGNKEAFVDLGPAIPVPPGLFTLSIKFSLNAQTTGKGTTKGHFNLEITEASAAAVGAFPFIEDGYAKAKPKCLLIVPGDPMLGTKAVTSGEVREGVSGLTGDDVSGQCFIGAVWDGGPVSGPDRVSIVTYAPCDELPPEFACLADPPSLVPLGTVTKGNIRIKP